MEKLRENAFQEVVKMVALELEKPGDKSLNISWLFERLLYEQKKKHYRVPYEVYKKIRYATGRRTLKELSHEFGLPVGLVHRILNDKYFKYE